jgi:hypothetical protein
MKATQGTSLRAPMLLVAVAGLALSASGCIISSSSSPRDSDLDGIADSRDLCPLDAEDFNGVQDADGCPETCVPDLTVSWRIRSNIDQTVITCSEAGGADTITAWISGGGLPALTAFDTACPAASSSGTFRVELPSSGTYDISLELVAGTTLLSETNTLRQIVDCSGLSATQQADLLVNF